MSTWENPDTPIYVRGLRDGLERCAADLAQAREQRDRARSLACRLEEELALIRRAAAARRHG